MDMSTQSENGHKKAIDKLPKNLGNRRINKRKQLLLENPQKTEGTQGNTNGKPWKNNRTTIGKHRESTTGKPKGKSKGNQIKTKGKEEEDDKNTMEEHLWKTEGKPWENIRKTIGKTFGKSSGYHRMTTRIPRRTSFGEP